MRRASIVFVLVLAWCLPRQAIAAERPLVRLEYTRGAGAASCPDEKSIAESVRVRLGYDPFEALATRAVRASITRQGKRLVGRVEVIGEDGQVQGERALASEDASCTELASTLTLAISIAIDALDTRAETAPPPPPVPTPAPQPPAPPADVVPRPEPAARTEGFELEAGGDGWMIFGATPSTDVGVAAFFVARRGRWSIGLEAGAAFPLGDRAAGRGSLDAELYAAELVPCVHITRVGLCATAGIGVLHGDGRGFDVDEHPSVPWVHVGLRAGVEIPLGAALFIRVHADVGTPLVPTTFYASGSGDAWTAAPVDVGGAAGIGVRL